jgi:hypothetical protein
MSTITELSTAVLALKGGVYSAHIIINDRLTSASCMHNHHSAQAAAKCCQMMQQRWDTIALNTHDVVCINGANLYEVRWKQARQVANGTWKYNDVATRFTYINADVTTA